jgi:hypothetical protein
MEVHDEDVTSTMRRSRCAQRLGRGGRSAVDRSRTFDASAPVIRYAGAVSLVPLPALQLRLKERDAVENCLPLSSARRRGSQSGLISTLAMFSCLDRTELAVVRIGDLVGRERRPIWDVVR